MKTHNGLLLGVIAAVLFAFTPLASAGSHGGGGGHGGGAHFSGSAGGFHGGGFNRAGSFNRGANFNGARFGPGGSLTDMVNFTARPGRCSQRKFSSRWRPFSSMGTVTIIITAARLCSTIRFTTAGVSLTTDTITAMVTPAMRLIRLIITKVAMAMEIIRSKWMCRARWPIADIITDAIDGVIGNGTRRAVRAFQRDVGLPVTGRIDSRLMRALRAS